MPQKRKYNNSLATIHDDGRLFCNKCGDFYHEAHFQKRTSSKKTSYYCYENKEKERESAWLSKLKTFFKITKEIYEKLLEEQNHCCQICKKEATTFKRKLCIDHNHSNDKIRGLLCTNCNNGIGLFREDTDLIDKAKNYVLNSNLLYNKAEKVTKLSAYDKLYFREIYLFKAYGINSKEYDNILSEQNNSCVICNLNMADYGKNFAIDHCHKTGNIRGLLCNSCNVGIAAFRDDEEIFTSAINYLNKYNS